MDTLRSTNIPTFKLGSRRKRGTGFFRWLLLLILALAIFQPGFPPGTAGVAAAQGSPEDQIRSAWERLQDADAYQFTADVEQTTYPLATIDNIGREAETNDVHMEGTVRRFERTMEMILWSQGGSVLNRESGAEIKVEGDRAYARSGSGEWQEIENFTGAFAPGGDFSVFLSAVKDAQIETGLNSSEQAAGLTRYSFEIDGKKLANNLLVEMRRQAAQDGSLPPGVEVALPDAYRKMAGSGEAWLDAAGYPVRQKITLKFPPQETEWVEAELDVVFSGWESRPVFSSQGETPGAFASSVERWYARGGDRQIAYGAAVAALCAALCIMFWKWGRTRTFNRAVVACVIVSTVFSPLMQSAQTAEYFSEEQARVQALQENAASAMEETLADIEESRKSSRMPAQAALEAISNDTGLDADRDGLTDVQEILVGTDPNRFDSTGLGMSDLQAAEAITGFDRDLLASDPGTDSDGDGLTDYQENLLGTGSERLDLNWDGRPDGVDTDMDGISDYIEVNGFNYNGKMWYTDPLKPDTNGDGIPDGVEWKIPDSAHNTWDLDGDDFPDVFDMDNDGDGVIDRLDLSPYAAPEKVFTKADPFTLAVSNLSPGKVTYVEFQFRPVITDQLRYAYNVLDWPYDTKGQVKDLDNANGDLKLIPMLEIRTGSTSSNLPLTSTPPRVSLKLQDMTGSSIRGDLTVTSWSSSQVKLQYSNLTPGDGLSHALYQGSCTDLIFAQDTYNLIDGQAILPVTLESLVNGNHAIVVTHSGDFSRGYSCANLPKLPREGSQWVDLELLNNYGISVVAQADGSKLVYAPIELTTVAQTQEKVAFYSKMVYRQGSQTWGAAHSIRLVWMVQALVDHCSGTQLWECEKLNNPEVIQSYYTDFKLTGLNLSENRGFETAVIYEDPAVDTDPNRDDTLFLLSHGLEQTFLAAYDCETVNIDNGVETCQGDGQPDYTIQKLHERFDHQANDVVSVEERFELPDILSVRKFSYDHADQAMADMATVQNPAILGDFSTDVYPTLMFASVQRSRGFSLDAGLDPAETDVKWNGNALALNLEDAQETTVAGLTWTPYRFRDGYWQVMPMEDYWDVLGTRYAGDFAAEENENVRAGSLLVVQMYYLALSQGVTRTIGVNGVRMPASYYGYERPVVFKALFFVGKVGTFLVDRLWMEAGKSFSSLAPRLSLEYLGTLGEKLFYAVPGGRLVERLFSSEASAASKFIAGAMIAGALLLVASAIAYTIVYFVAKGHKSPAADVLVTIGDVMIAGATIALTLGKTIGSMLSAAWAFAKHAVGVVGKVKMMFTSLYSTLGSSSTAIGNSMYANVISFVVQLGIIWGTFFYAWASGAVQPGTGAFGSVLALTIAQTILAIFFFILSLTVVGTIIAGIVSSVDAILTLLCSTFGVKSACFTISGAASQTIAKQFFSFAPTVDLSRSTLGAVRDIDYDLEKPDLGYVAGNKVYVRATLHTTLRQDWVENTDWVRIAYNASKMITPDTLKQATVKYALNAAAPESKASEMASQWTIIPYDRLNVEVYRAGLPRKDELEFTVYQADGDYTTGPSPITLKAGINRKIPAQLYISYAIPAAECWGSYQVSRCLERSVEGKVEESFDLGLSLDVFPATLDEFYALDWGSFPVQRDWDGDGLVNAEAGGLDGDDRNWDQDGDGIPDGREVELRKQGVAVRYEDPEIGYDTDGDGLSDGEELLLGTDPAKADTDRDGLTDKEELDGWLWAYSADKTTLETLVRSDPTIADTDGDGNLDRLERDLYRFNREAYYYHPRRVDPLSITFAQYIDDPDGYVSSYQTFNYIMVMGNTTPITAPLNINGSVEVSEVGEPNPSLLTIASPTSEFGVVQSGESYTLSTEVLVQYVGDYTGMVLGLESEATATFFPPDASSTPQWVDLDGLQWEPMDQWDEYRDPIYAALVKTTGWDSPFLMAALEGTFYSNIYGDIAHAQLGSELVSLDDLDWDNNELEYADTPVAVACNNITGYGGHCLVVWSREQTSTSASYDLIGRLVRQNGGGSGQPFVIAEETCDEILPSAASNGQDFLVSWTCDGSLKARAVNVPIFWEGEQFPPEGILSIKDVYSEYGDMDDGASSVAWTGDAYTVVWEKTSWDAGVNNVRFAAVQLDASGSYIADSGGILSHWTGPAEVDHSAPQIAYRPESGDSLVVYRLGGSIDALLLENSNFSSPTNVHIASLGSDSAFFAPRVAYDPRWDGWVVAWAAQTATGPASRWQSVSADGSLFGPQNVVGYGGYAIDGDDLSLACAALECALLTHSPLTSDEHYYFLQRYALKPVYSGNLGEAVIQSTGVLTFTLDFHYPNVDSIMGIPPEGRLTPGSHIVLGGEASDALSGIERVEVCLTGRTTLFTSRCDDDWQPAEGRETWVYGLQIPDAAGIYDLEVRAVDRAGNVEIHYPNRILFVDGTPPTISSDQVDGPVLRLDQNEEGSFLLPLSGTLLDKFYNELLSDEDSSHKETYSNRPGMSLEAMVSPGNADWQPAVILYDDYYEEHSWIPVPWEMDYVFSSTDAEGILLDDPSGVYTVTLRARDMAGAVTEPDDYVTFQVYLDHSAPVSTLSTPNPGKTTGELGDISVEEGNQLITETLTLNGTIAETGLAQSGVAGQEVRLRPLDLPIWPGVWSTAYSNPGDPAPSLVRVEQDAPEGGLDLSWGAAEPAPGITAEGFNASWQRLTSFKVTGEYTFTVEKDTNSVAEVYLDGVAVLQAIAGETTKAGSVDAGAGLHDLVVRYTDGGDDAYLRFDVELKDAVWYQATLTASGSGVNSASWQYPLPDGAEGFYEIDLRGADVLDNRYTGSAVRWRGEIDTAAPRLQLAVDYTGVGLTARTTYRVWASDFNLSEDGWESPCGAVGFENRYNYSSPWWDAKGGTTTDQTRLYQFYSECSVAGHVEEPPLVKACDIYGHCTEGSSQSEYISPNRRVIYLVEDGGRLAHLDLNTGLTTTLVTEGVTATAVSAQDGWIYYPQNDILRGMDPATHRAEDIFTNSLLQTGVDYTVGHSAVYWSDSTGLHHVYHPGDTGYQITGVTGGLKGLDFDEKLGLVFAAGGDEERGQIYIHDYYTDAGMFVNGADSDTHNSWSASLIAVDSEARQIYLAGECGDPAGGAPGVSRGRIYGIHRLPYPNFQAGTTLEGVTGCTPVIRITDVNDVILDVNLDTLTNKLYYLLHDTAAGVYSLWRANLDGSFRESIYTSDSPIQSFAIDEGNSNPVAYPTYYTTYSESQVYTRLHVYDPDLSDRFTFEYLKLPQHGTLLSWPSGPSYIANAIYKPAPDFKGLDTFTFQADDSRGGVITGTVQISVTSNYLDSVILSPTQGEIVQLGEEVTVTIGLRADQGIKRLEVMSNHAPFDLKEVDFSAGITETQHTFAFTPAETGSYVLRTTLFDAADRSKSGSNTVEFYVIQDNPPQIDIATEVLTTADLLSDSSVYIEGTATDSTGGHRVFVDLYGEYGGREARVDGENWRAEILALPAENDYITYTVAATVKDALNQYTMTTKTILFDLLPPAPVTVSLGLEGGGTLEPGQTLRDLTPLTMLWTASSDGSGVVEYFAGWTKSDTPPADGAGLTYFDALPVDPMTFTPEDMNTYYAHLGLRDALGNFRWQSYGPFYVDSPATPDPIGNEVIANNYYGWFDWMNSGSTQIGADYTLYHLDPIKNSVQRFYLTWDADYLALAWEGIEKLDQDDLYIYLDTGVSGGAVYALDPDESTHHSVQLPAGMGADYLIHVADRYTAQLMKWVGNEWELVTSANASDFRLLSKENYKPSGSYLNTTQGIRTAFDLLEIDILDNATLDVVALLTRGSDLELYAAIPDQNPLNGTNTLSPLAQPDAWRPDEYSLTQKYHWDSLALGQRPNAGKLPGSDLRVWISAEPAGLTVGFLDSDLYNQLIPGVSLDANLDGLPDVTLPLSASPPVVDGQEITYTVHYQNRGDRAAEDVTIDLSYSGALVDGPESLALGMIQPGESGEVTFTAVADSSEDPDSGEMQAVISDSVHGAFDWYWVLHVQDPGAPRDVTIDYADLSQSTNLRTGWHTAGGHDYDPSGVDLVELEVTYPGDLPENPVVNSCLQADLSLRTWSCAWNAYEGVDGEVGLRARAHDVGGLWSEWTDVFTVTVDDSTPSITLDPGLLDIFANDFVSGPSVQFYGTSANIDQVQVCTDGVGYNCKYAEAASDDEGGAWTASFSPVYGDGEVYNYTVRGWRSGWPVTAWITGTYRVDSYPPDLSFDCLDNEVNLADYWSGNPSLVPAPLIGGTVTDSGSGVAGMSGYVVDHSTGDVITTTLLTVGAEGAFSYTPRFDSPGYHNLWLSSSDNVGNTETGSACLVHVLPGDVDLSMQASVSQAEFYNNGEITFTIAITNNSNWEAHGVELEFHNLWEVIPGAVSASPSTVNCWTSGAHKACYLGNIEPYDQMTVTLTGQVQIPMWSVEKTVSVYLKSAEYDTNYNDNKEDFNIDLNNHTDLQITHSGLPAQVYRGNTITYTINVTNAGPTVGVDGDIVTVMGTSFFPDSAFSFRGASGEGWNCGFSPSYPHCRHAMVNGAFPELEIELSVKQSATPGVYTSTASVQPYSALDPDGEDNTSEASIEVLKSADLNLTKTIPPETETWVDPGSELTYTLTVQNQGPDGATGLVLTDTLPAGVDFLSAESEGAGWLCDVNGTIVTCTRASLQNGAESAVTITTQVTTPDTTLTNRASVSGSEYDPDLSDNHASVSTNARSQADLSIVKEASATDVLVGASITYTLSVTNNGLFDIPSETESVSVEDTLSEGMSLVMDETGGEGWYCWDTESEGSPVLHCTRSGIAAGKTETITVTAIAPETLGPFTNSAAVAVTAPGVVDPNSLNNSDSAEVNALGRPDLELVKTAPGAAAAGDLITYNLTVRNTGSASAENVVITDTLPAGLTYSSSSSAGWECSDSGGTVTCSLEDPLAVGLQAQVELTARADIAASEEVTVTNMAEAATSGAESNLDNNRDSAATTVGPTADLEAMLSADGSVYLGAETEAIIRVINNGPASATPVVTITLSGDVDGWFTTIPGWSCPNDYLSTQNVCQRSAPLAPGEDSTITVGLSPYSVSDFSLQAEVSGNLLDRAPGNNTAEISVEVLNAVDLGVWKRVWTDYGDSLLEGESGKPPFVIPGGTITYTLQVYNYSLADTSNITVTDVLPVGLIFVEFLDVGSWTCSESNGAIICTLPGLEAGEDEQPDPIEFLAQTGDDLGEKINTVQVSSAVHELNSEDNSAEARVIVADDLIDLAVRLDPVQPLYAGETFEVTATVSNGGPYPAPITFTAALPGGLVLDEILSDGWACNPSRLELTCTRDNLPLGVESELALRFAGSPAGRYPIGVVVSSDGYNDLDDRNDEDDLEIVVKDAADLSIVKEVSLAEVEADGPLTFTLTAHNNGPSAAYGVRITDVLPAGTSFVSAAADMDGTLCSEVGGVVTCEINPSMPILLVNRSYYPFVMNISAQRAANALDSLGVPYTSLDRPIGSPAAPPPTAADLSPYSLVVWVAHDYGALNAADEEALAGYLDGGGRLFLIAQQYLGDSGPTDFMRDYLGVDAGETNVGPTNIQGANNFAGIEANFALSNSSGDWIYPTTSAQAAFTGDKYQSTDRGPVAVYTDQTMFFAFDWYTLYRDDPDGSLAIFRVVLDHFLQPLGVGEDVTITIQANAPSTHGDYTNSAQVEVYTHDLGLGNNQDSAVFTVKELGIPDDVDLSLTMTASADPVLAGARLVYELIVYNTLGTATGVTLVDTLPAGVVFESASPGCSAPVPPGRNVICSLPDLGEGAEAEVTISVTVEQAAVGPLVNTAVITTEENDTNMADNTAEAAVAVIYQQVILEDDFEEGASPAWCSRKTGVTPAGGRGFLGEFNNETVCLLFENLPEHSQVTVSFDLYIIRSWDGNQLDYPEDFHYQFDPVPAGPVGEDRWMLEADGKTLLHTTFANSDPNGSVKQSYPGWWPEAEYPARTGSLENNTLGYDFYGTPLDSVYHLTFTFAHASDLLRFDFSAFGLQDIHDESWGLDNVKVTLTSGSGQMPYRIYLPILMR